MVFTGRQEHAQLHVRRAQREEATPSTSSGSRAISSTRSSPACRAARLALHVCRGNWTRDERAALAGDYRPLLPLLEALDVGTFFLELATPRAGEIEVLADLPARPPRSAWAWSIRSTTASRPWTRSSARAERAIKLFGPERVLLTPDCGFATFADNPVASAQVAEAKLRAIADAVAALRGKPREET